MFGDKDGWMISLRDLFQIKSDDHFPQEDDLLRLCEEEGLDFIVLKYRIKDLYCESDGEYYIYDCEQLRNLRSEVGVHGQNRPDGRPANHDNLPVKGEGKTSTVTLRGYGGDFPRGVVLPGNTTADSSGIRPEASCRATGIQ